MILSSLIQIQGANLDSHNKHQVWKSIDLSLSSNQIHAVIGESGSGKTTLAYSLFGLIPEGWSLDSKHWSILGLSFEESRARLHSYGQAKRLFLVPQNPNLAFHPYRPLGDQISDFFRFGLDEPFDKERILSLWQDMGIRLDNSTLSRLPSTLSGGEKQRICLSLAFLANPRILVLDEPTTGLDASTEFWVLSKVKEMAKTSGSGVVFISHDLRIVASLASQITIMKEGRVIETLQVKDKKFEPETEYGKALEHAHQIFA